MKKLLPRWKLVFKVLPIIFCVIVAKIVIHSLGLDKVASNPLLASLIGGTVFLLAFLNSGIMADYKESEKLPGELASSLEVLFDEAYIIYKIKKEETAKNFLIFVAEFANKIIKWFYQKESMETLYSNLHSFNDTLISLETMLTKVTLIGRMKQEQSAIRKTLTRINTIRTTNFVPAAHTLIEILATMVIGALLIIQVDKYVESIFFISLISFLIIYMILLIKDLDDPFKYTEGENDEIGEVSIQPLKDVAMRLQKRLEEVLSQNQPADTVSKNDGQT